jgi:hypothetical protein
LKFQYLQKNVKLMKNSAIGAWHRKAFRNNYAAALIAGLLISTSTYSQVDTNRIIPRANVNGQGYKNLAADSSMQFPQDTLFLKSTWNAIAFKDGIPYYWNNTKMWYPFGSGAGGGGSFGGNIGSGYRVYKPSSNANKSIFGGYGITWDSSSNSNALTSTLDSATAFAQIRGTIKWPLKVITNQFGNSTDTILYNPLSDHGFALALDAFGDSFTNPGLNASTDSSYISRLAYFLGLTLNNYGVSGRGVAIAVANHNIYINPGHSIFASIMSGFNDLRRTNAADPITYRKTLNKIINAYKAMFVNQYLKVFYEAGSGNVTRYGAGWSTGYNPQLVNGKSGTGAITTALNDSVNYIFTGETNVVAATHRMRLSKSGWCTRRSHPLRAFNWYSDKDTTFTLNNQWDGISDGTNNNQRGPYALVFHDLSKTKTYKLKLICKQAGNQFAVDYVGHLVDPAAGMQMIVFDPAYMDATGYAIAPAGASNAVMDEGKRVIDSTINYNKRTFPVYIANTIQGMLLIRQVVYPVIIFTHLI